MHRGHHGPSGLDAAHLTARAGCAIIRGNGGISRCET